MTRYLFFTLTLIIISISVYSQAYRNEWIDYNKTYYKFKIGPFGTDIVGAPIKNGIVRISGNTLKAAGLASVPAEQFQLWRNGVEVPVYTSQPFGALGTTDYIEFWGDINDGKADKELYRNPAYQLSDYWSLQSDSVSYFLTINPSGNNKRFVPAMNTVASTTISAEKNFMYTTGRYFRTQINPGFASVTPAERLYSSAYDKGEGWTSRPVRPNTCNCNQKQLPQGFSPLYADVSGSPMILTVNSLGNALNTRRIQLYVNNTPVYNYQMDYFSDAKVTVNNISTSLISSDNVTVIAEDQSAAADDEMEVATIQLTYPRTFNFGNATSFMFDLPASDTGRYLKIYNFNKGTSVPVLYDLTNGKRYVADVTYADTFRFLLAPSAAGYHLALARGDGSAARFVSTLQKRNFIDYSQAANQGNYLIISNPLLYGSTGTDYVDQYRAYRSSADGGGYNVRVINIDEITDQFAYGINKHPMSIKNFLRYARNNFSQKPSFVFLIGKAVSYNYYKTNETNATANKINLVPTWGYPGSDNLLSSPDSYNPIPAIPIGRLSAATPQEVGDYLDKVKTYEALQKQESNNTVTNKGWQKNVIHIVGSNDEDLGVLLDNYTNNYKEIISDTSYGGVVATFSKTADPAGYPQAIVDFKSVYEKGSSLVEYFGHSSSTSLDFNLDNPYAYNNTGKYPFFIVNGCLAGNIFDYDANRLTLKSAISEKFVLAPQLGAIGYLATSSYGIVNYLDTYTGKVYEAISQTQYGKGLGEITQDALSKGLQIIGLSDFYGRLHAEQFTLHADPAIKMNAFPKPDYAIESSLLNISPSYVSVADDSFNLKVQIYNLGKAVKDSLLLNVYKKNTNNNNNELIFSKLLAPIKGTDSLIIPVSIIPDKDSGVNTITAVIDENNAINEADKTNNTASVSFMVNESEIRPVFPYKYAIVNANPVNLYASTANPLAASATYLMELDTTTNFNSALKKAATVTSVGGVIKFSGISLPLANQTYFWRVSRQGTNHWNVFSFTYNKTNVQGFEQASYYQHTESTFEQMRLDSSTRNFAFNNKLTNVYIQHSIYPTSGTQDAQFSIQVNGNFVTWSACVGSSVIFNVFDTVSFKPLENTTNPFGAAKPCDPTRKYNFEFSTQTAAARKNAMDFLDNIPDGKYVIVRKIYDQGNKDWAPTVWANDTALYGHNNSLYHRLKAQGVAIDSFTHPRTFVFVFRKNDSAHYQPMSYLSNGLYDRISVSFNVTTIDTSGYVTSPKFGPGKVWNAVKWNGYSADSATRTNLDVIGVTSAGADSVLYTIDTSTTALNVSGIDPVKYPYVKLRYKTQDSLYAKAYQLNQWSVEYQGVAEGGMAPNLGYSLPDTLAFTHVPNVTFDTLSGYVTFKNVSNVSSFRPLNAKLTLFDSTGKSYVYNLANTRSIPVNDTVHISFLQNVTALPEGKYNMLLEVNPNNVQSDQFSFNNTLYKYLYLSRVTALPVHLINFTATPQSHEVLTKWLVTNEMNLNRYEVEYSTNASDFIRIANVQAKGNNVMNRTYTFLHQDPLNGKNYYRLKMVDNDGSFTYSAIRVVDLAEATINVYPNPFMKQLNVNAGTATNVTLRLFNASGQKLLQQSFSGSVTIDTDNLSAGNYLLQVDDGTRIRVFKLQKRR